MSHDPPQESCACWVCQRERLHRMIFIRDACAKLFELGVGFDALEPIYRHVDALQDEYRSLSSTVSAATIAYEERALRPTPRRIDQIDEKIKAPKVDEAP